MNLPESEPSEDQLARRQRSEGILRAALVRINPHLPMIESEAETRIRAPQEVAERLLALNIVAVKGEGLEQKVIARIVEERGVRPLFTPDELAFIDDPAPSEHDRLQFVWRYEAAWVLFWSLNFVRGPLGLPSSLCDVPLLAETVHDTTDLTVNGMRSTKEVLDEADLIYRCHWAVRQAGLERVVPSGGLDPGVTMERHHALNWLIGYDDADWDDVATDT